MREVSISIETYQWIAYAWIAVAVVVFVVLHKVRAPYGRHTSAGWGPQIDNRIGWLIMESPVLIVVYACVIPARAFMTAESWVMVGLLTLHYVYRVLIYPFRLNTKGKKMPVVIVGSAICFNLMNGFLLGYYFANFQDYPTFWFGDPRFIIGICLFFVGMYINQKADHLLIHLRKPNETHYVIPKGWLFNRISCPNHFGEIVEWGGYALLCWNLPALAFFVWTCANLVPRAIAHHRWYREKFSDYPINRKAVFPFIY